MVQDRPQLNLTWLNHESHTHFENGVNPKREKKEAEEKKKKLQAQLNTLQFVAHCLE